MDLGKTGVFDFLVKAGWKWWTLKSSVWLTDETGEIMDDFCWSFHWALHTVHHVGNGVP